MQEMCLLLSCFRFDTSPIDGDYRVIDVDYDKFVVVYSCTQLLFLKYELAWILTRDQIVNQSLVRENFEILVCSYNACFDSNYQ